VDTWGWLVLADAREAGHVKAVEEYRRRATPGRLVTTDYVLDEVFTRLFARVPHQRAREVSQGIVNAASTGFLRMERIVPERFEAAYRMRLRYRDQPRISFTDFTSFAVMKELRIRNVLTADAHFTKVNLGFRRLP
jgi:predicted nucleic acid-binding protein